MKKLEALIDAVRPAGDVLQIGFPNAAAAMLIQKFHPASHTVIEADSRLAPLAKKWAAGHRAALIEEPWGQALGSLGVFDAVFYFGEDSGPLMKESRKIGQEFETLFPNAAQIRYSDADLELLCSGVSKSAPRHLAKFLAELEAQGQITHEQRAKVQKKYKIESFEAPPIKRADSVYPLLKQCLASHMRKGSRFACFINESKWEDPRFFEEIAVNPSLDAKEWKVEEALILLVEKLA